jgi:uncharacterized protein YecE (DUF72 family)
MLAWYANRFNTVEINNTFYRLPTEEALLQWKKTAPANFLFSVKASRFITHMKRLRDPEATIENFFSRAILLGEHLGPVLFQLPPRWQVNAARMEEFLEALPPKYRYVFEFRDGSWYTEPVFRVLRRYSVAVCIHDWQNVQWPIKLTAGFAYVRFHGPAGNYSGNYPASFLKHWAVRVREWERSLKQVWIYFNNDVGGHAVRNAITLRRLVSQSQPMHQMVA